MNKEKKDDKTSSGKGSRKMYTYILKDVKLNVYKIGKSTEPLNRFKSLCKRSRVMPIALIDQDVEKNLHKLYAENRIFHSEYRYNGATEWFRRGGQFDKFIDQIDRGKFLPYIPITSAAIDWTKGGTIKIVDTSTEWDLSNSTFGFYFIGMEILKMLGYVRASSPKTPIINKDADNVMVIGRRVSISDAIFNQVVNKYKIYLCTDRNNPLFTSNLNAKGGSRLRKIPLERQDFDADVFLILNKVL